MKKRLWKINSKIEKYLAAIDETAKHHMLLYVFVNHPHWYYKYIGTVQTFEIIAVRWSGTLMYKVYGVILILLKIMCFSYTRY